MKAKWGILLALGLTISLAGYLRTAHLADNPAGLNQDEAVMGYDAYAIAYTGRDHHGHFLPLMTQGFNDWPSVTLTYLTVPFVRFLGLSVVSTRLPNALLNTAAVGLVFLILQSVLKRPWYALLGALLLAFTPWHLLLSRWALTAWAVPFFILLVLQTVLWAASADRSKKSKLNYRWLGVSLSLILLTYTHQSQQLYGLLLALMITALYWRRSSFRNQLLALGGYLLGVAPLFYLLLSNPSQYLMRYQEVKLSAQGWQFIQAFLQRYWEYLSPHYFFGEGTPNLLWRVPHYPHYFSFLQTFFYIGILFSLLLVLFPSIARLSRYYGVTTSTEKGIDRRAYLLLLAWLFTSPIPASLTNDTMHLTRSIVGMPAGVIFSVLGIYAVMALLPLLLQGGLLIWLVLSGGRAYLAYNQAFYTEYQALSRYAFHYGINDAVQYLSEHESEFSEVVIDNRLPQAYIYYLFYSRYDPRTLNYAEINAPAAANGWTYVPKIGKYSFWDLSQLKEQEGSTVFLSQVGNNRYCRVVKGENGRWYLQPL